MAGLGFEGLKVLAARLVRAAVQVEIKCAKGTTCYSTSILSPVLVAQRLTLVTGRARRAPGNRYPRLSRRLVLCQARLA